MAKLRVTGRRGSTVVSSKKLMCCPRIVFHLDSGEVVKRGCGMRGLFPMEGGWRCFYCGHYLYDPTPQPESMWFHFRWAREFWRVQNDRGRDFVNGMPVAGRGDTLPVRLVRDLAEKDPPEWFHQFLVMEEKEFTQYLDQSAGG